jgi:hypothetical protein
VAGVECIDDPTVACIDTDVAGPPKDVTGAYLVDRNFRQGVGDVVGRPRYACSYAPPSRLGEPRTVETGGTGTAPTIRLSDLGSGERDDFERLDGRGRLASLPRPRHQSITGKRSAAATGCGKEDGAEHDERTDSEGRHRHEPIVTPPAAK